MIISVSKNLSTTYSNSFKAGRATLYSDFDGTFLPQPLHDIYNGSSEAKERSVRNFNKYFRDFQNFIDSTKGKFSIIINTGRRLNGDNKDGFEPTLMKMRESGIVLPKIDSLITSSGGDIYKFNADGTLNPSKEMSKLLQIKKVCGWDNEEIVKALDIATEEIGCKYKFVNNRGSFKLSTVIDDTKKLSELKNRLSEILNPKMGIDISISDVTNNGRKQTGLKLSPLINNHHLHKDFDVKNALKNAISNNDFLIVAGDASNDKEALNIFRYLTNPPAGKIPTSSSEITTEYIDKVKSEIDKLPIKIMFIEPNLSCTDQRTLKLYEFMQSLEKQFPKKVKIVKETKLDGENNFLNSIKSAINEYSGENQIFSRNFNSKINKKLSKSKLILILGTISLILIGLYHLYKKNKSKTNNNP